MIIFLLDYDGYIPAVISTSLTLLTKAIVLFQYRINFTGIRFTNTRLLISGLQLS